MRLGENATQRRIAQAIFCMGWARTRIRAEDGAVVEITSVDESGAPFACAEIVGGIKVQLSPVVRPLQEKLIVPAYPKAGLMLMAVVTDCPAETVALLLEEETEKFGPIALTATEAEVLGRFATSPE
jgi:hypothetical protein